MGAFVSKHPILTFLIALAVLGTVRAVVSPPASSSAPTPPVP